MTVMTKITTTGHTGHLPNPPVTVQERRAVIYTAGVWLVFLVWTVIGFLTTPAPVVAQILGWVALAIFPFAYLQGFLVPEPFARLNRHGNTLVYTLVVTVLGLIMAQVAPIALINIVPYLMALWIFNHRLVTGLVAVVIIFLAAVGVVFFGDLDGSDNWFIASVVSPAVIMVFIRISIELGANQQERSEQLALASQREDLASTVHDVLGHSLTTITVKVQLAQRLFDADPVAAKTELAEIEMLARSSLTEVRSAVADLQHPDLVEQLEHSGAALRAAGIQVASPVGLPRLTLVQQQVFAWVIRESVTNVIRHAQATTCRISVTQQENLMVLQIDDDGVGIADTDPANHHGLAGLQRRVTAVGGRLTLMRLHPGTRVEVVL